MTHETTLLYIALRKEKLIGKLFGSESEGYKLAPKEALKWLEWSSAESIGEVALVSLIERLASEAFGYMKVERKPARKERKSGWNHAKAS